MKMSAFFLDVSLHEVAEGCWVRKPTVSSNKRRFTMTAVNFEVPAMVVMSIQWIFHHAGLHCQKPCRGTNLGAPFESYSLDNSLAF